MSWIALIGALAVLLTIDLLVVRGRGGEMSLRAAAVASALWVAVALAFGAVLLLAGERADAEAFLAGYLVEKSLSLDNVFVFLLVFTAFGLPVAERHRLLSYGIVAALALRLVFIVAGAAALGAFGWLSFVFAAFLVWTGWKCCATATTTAPRRRWSSGSSSGCARPRPLGALDRRRRVGGHRDRGHHLRRRLGAGDPRHHERHVHRLRRQRFALLACGRCSSSWPTWSSASTTSRPRSPSCSSSSARRWRRPSSWARSGRILPARDRRDPRPGVIARSSAIAARYFANAISWSHPRHHNPLRRSGAVDLTPRGQRRSLLDAGLGLFANGTIGKARSLSADERRSVIEALVDAAGGRVTVTAGVSAQTAEAATAYARAAADAGAGALMLLPPLMYGGDEREVLAFYAAVAAATDLPIMAYNNPVASGGTDMLPAFILRLAREVDAVVAIKECSGDARRLAELLAGAGDGFEVLVGGDDWALEGFAAGATGWISGVVERRAGGVRRAAPPRPGRRARGRARALHAAAAARPARHDPEARAVLQGRAGRRRPRRRPVPAAAARAHRRGSRAARRGARRAARPAGARLRAARVFAAVDSHTEGMPTRVDHRRRRPAPRRARCSSASCTSRPSTTTCGGC